MSKRVLILSLLIALVAAGAVSGEPVSPAVENAWEALLKERPEAVDDVSLTPLERRILQVLTPEQGRAFAEGADPRTLVLASGETLADFIGQHLKGAAGLVYHPVDECTVVRTATSVLGKMGAGATRDFLARGATNLSAQGGSPLGCGIPAEAEAMLANFVVSAPNGSGSFKSWPSDAPEPASVLIRYKPTVDDIIFANASVVGLCVTGPCASDFKARTISAATHVRIDALGYFAPGAAGDDGDWTVSGSNLSSAVSGNVGIGTSSPVQKLHVAGGIRLDAGHGVSFGASSVSISEAAGDLDIRAVDVEIDSTSQDIELDSNDDIVIDAVDTVEISGDLIEIDSPAVGIGTASPDSDLQIGSPGDTANHFLQIDSRSGAPSSSDCNSNSERGRMIHDLTNNRLYVCGGSSRGWDFIALTN